MALLNAPMSYYTKKGVDDLFTELGSSPQGLKDAEAERRLKEYGKNVFSEKKKLTLLNEFLSHFKSPLILILVVAAVVSEILGEVADAVIILIMILLSVILDFFLEHNAEEAAEKLKERVKTKTVVIRDGEKKEIKTEDVCIGDIVFLSAGSLVPADARIITAKDFFVNQSTLTGESFPVEKTESRIEMKDSFLTEATNLLFMGTNVVSGSATALVIKTGKDTEFGKIAEKLVAVHEETEFDRGISSFGNLIMKATFFLVLFIFLFNSLIKHNVLQSFIFAIAVAVGLIPELLPMIMSVTMAQGSMKMAKKGVIVKKLSSIPNFGSMDILCTDKTGTLTEDKIHLVKYTDVFGKESEKSLLYAYLTSFYQTGIANPLDEAVLNFRRIDVFNYEKIDEIPFDFSRKRMSVVVENAKKRYFVSKGAPEEIFNCSSTYYNKGKSRKFDKKTLEKIKSQYYGLSKEGYRVLAVAIKKIGKQKEYTKKDEINLELIGFVSFLDPPKSDAKEVVKQLKEVGVEMKIITGDNELVTKKICDEINLPIKGILMGNEINELTDDALKVRVESTTIFARFSPDQKNRIIRALRSNGHVVGYMGDGINDAPSLRTADIGISVDKAVDVAKESADIVLTRKSLSELKEGIMDGRKTFANTMKYIMMGLSSNFGNMFSVAFAILFLPFLPMLPIQILLNNFIYDFSQITIPSDNVDKEYIERPRRWNMGFIKKFMLVFGPVSSIFDVLTFVVLYYIFKAPESVFQTGWFIESLATQSLVIFVIRTRKIPFIQSFPSRQLLFSTVLCVMIGTILPYTILGKYFGLVPLPLNILLAIGGLFVGYIVLVEIVKRIFYSKVDY